MDDVRAIEDLMARYCRTLDLQDWDGFRAVFTDDAVLDATAIGSVVYEGGDAFIEAMKTSLVGVTAVHHVLMPEIEITSATTATGTWAMEDRMWFPNGKTIHGFGHYHQRYVKVDGRWLLQHSKVVKHRIDVGGA